MLRCVLDIEESATSGDVKKMKKAIQVRVLHTEGCPNASPTIDLMEQIGAEIGVTVAVERVLVSTPEEAIKVRCLGSPTVQIAGNDIDPEARASISFGIG